MELKKPKHYKWLFLLKLKQYGVFFHFSIFWKSKLCYIYNITFIIKYETKMTTDSPAQPGKSPGPFSITG